MGDEKEEETEREGGAAGPPSPPHDRRAVKKTREEYLIDRRDAIRGIGLTAVLGLLSAASGAVIYNVYNPPRARAPTGKFPLVYEPPPSGAVPWYESRVGEEIVVDHFGPGDWAYASAAGVLKREVLLMRLSSPPADPDRAGGWIEDINLVAFYVGCVHACCDVWEPSGEEIPCVCHGSRFDARRLQKAVEKGVTYFGAPPLGGPARRPLPQAPLEIDADGRVKLVVEARSRDWYSYC